MNCISKSQAQENFKDKITSDTKITKDPFPYIAPALLNSADIKKYINEVSVVYPFDENRLKGATYEVGIGDKVIWWDSKSKKQQEKQLTESDPFFVLKPNSIMFVELDTYFQIPDYMVLRFNLKIQHVYKGLLLGTGPIVDPGFIGKLSIPLHNLTANEYTFRLGEGMILMEFTKLSPNKCWGGSDKYSVCEDAYIKNESPHDRTLTQCIHKAIGGGKMVRSSIPEKLRKIQRKTKKTQKDFFETKKSIERRVGSIQLIAVISVVLAFISILAFAYNIIKPMGDAYTNSLNQKYSELESKYNNDINMLKKEIEQLKQSENNLKIKGQDDAKKN